MASLSSVSDYTSRPVTVQSLPATPSAANVRTFTDYSGEHTRLTTLHGSTGALEVNNLGGFKLGPAALANSNSAKFASALESSIDGIVRTSSSVSVSNSGMGGDFGSGMSAPLRNGRGNGGESLGLVQGLLPKHTTANVGMTMSPGTGMHSGAAGMGSSMNGIGNGMMNQFHSMQQPHHGPPPGVGVDPGMPEVDDMADVFTGLSFKEPSMVAAPGYGRTRPRRASAPVGVNGEHGGFGAIGPQNGYGLWGNGCTSENPLPEKNIEFHAPTSRNSPTQQFASTNGGSYSAGMGPHPTFNTAWVNGQSNGGSKMWAQGSMGNGNSRPNSQTSSLSNDSSIQSSPIYSPTNSSSGFGGFVPNSTSVSDIIPTSLGMGLLTTTPLGMPGMMVEERAESRSPFRVRSSYVCMCMLRIYRDAGYKVLDMHGCIECWGQ